MSHFGIAIFQVIDAIFSPFSPISSMLRSPDFANEIDKILGEGPSRGFLQTLRTFFVKVCWQLYWPHDMQTRKTKIFWLMLAGIDWGLGQKHQGSWKSWFVYLQPMIRIVILCKYCISGDLSVPRWVHRLMFSPDFWMKGTLVCVFQTSEI